MFSISLSPSIQSLCPAHFPRAEERGQWAWKPGHWCSPTCPVITAPQQQWESGTVRASSCISCRAGQHLAAVADSDIAGWHAPHLLALALPLVVLGCTYAHAKERQRQRQRKWWVVVWVIVKFLFPYLHVVALPQWIYIWTCLFLCGYL